AGDAAQLRGFSFGVAFPDRIVVRRTTDGAFAAAKEEAEITRTVFGASATIRSSLFAAGEKAGIPVPVLAEVLKMYSWDVDFQREVRSGDNIEVLFERLGVEDSTQTRAGHVIAAALTLSGQRRILYRYESADGFADFYEEDGRSARKPLMRTPVDGARLSSRYGMRRHPILGYSRMHQGVDFAAPIGTPIFAAGDGRIAEIGRKSGYGKYARITHHAGYATAYAHMNRFARGLRAGSKVKQGQVIGYVGNTGRSTGPHLHYEVLLNGKQINPMLLKRLPGRKLSGQQLADFRAFVASSKHQFASLVPGTGAMEFAEADTDPGNGRHAAYTFPLVPTPRPGHL
ncbi:MAG: M23 family metallopeptidase, partial [Rhodospirillales bacterium]|nr:M23 family metallopeptidase [Rhodospirillales bacterium]